MREIEEKDPRGMTKSKPAKRLAEKENPYASPSGESKSWNDSTRIAWWIGVFLPVGLCSVVITISVVGSPGLQQLANSWRSEVVLYGSLTLTWLASVGSATTYREAAVWGITGTAITFTLICAVFFVFSVIYVAMIA